MSGLRIHHKIILPRAGVLIEMKDLVTFAEEGVPRGKWRLQKVEEMIIENDGKITEVRVKVKVLSKKEKPLYLTGLTVQNL